MQRIRTFVQPPELRAFPVHADAIEPRRRVETITLIRPPAVDAEIEHALVMRPVAADAALLRPFALGDVTALVRCASAALRGLALVLDGPGEMASFDDDVEDDLVVHRVQLVDSLLRLGECLPLP